MKKMKYCVSLLFFCFIAMGAQAQEEAELTEAQKKEFQLRVKQKVEEFQNGLSKMVNTELSHEARVEHQVNVLKKYAFAKLNAKI